MGFLEFIILCFLVLAIAWMATWALGYFLPGHPAIVDKLIWGIAVAIILITLLQATGIMKHDPQIPHF